MKRSLIVWLLVFVVCALIVEALFFYGMTWWSLKSFADERSQRTGQLVQMQAEEGLRDMVQAATSIVERAYVKSRDLDALKKAKAEMLRRTIDGVHAQLTAAYAANKGRVSDEELRRILKEMVRPIRFAGGNYVWINDMGPRMVMHPIKPEMEGQDLADYADPAGKKLFVEMVERCKAQGDGMVDYQWTKPGEKEHKPKVSYVRLMPELGWVIGTGEWVEDVTEALKQEALAQIAAIRAKDGNYVWINDLEPRMVMHPLKPEMNGKPLGDYKDPRGKLLFMEMVAACKEKGEGFVSYMWGKPGQAGEFPKLSFVRLFPAWGWVIGHGVYMDDMERLVRREKELFVSQAKGSLNQVTIGLVLFLIVLSSILIWGIRHFLMLPLKRLLTYAGAVAGGNLDLNMQCRCFGEIRELGHALQAMVASLRQRIYEVQLVSAEAKAETERAQQASVEAEKSRQAALRAKQDGMLEAAGYLDAIVEALDSSSAQLKDLFEQINHRTQEQRSQLHETVEAMSQMDAAVAEIATTSTTAAQVSGRARDRANEGASVVQNSVGAIHSVQDMALALRASMGQLSGRAESISAILGVISDIADQTNLLALNAAIEAARAGDAGRGFAVVADEVRKLAEKTMHATGEVSESIVAIQRSTAENLRSVDLAVEAVQVANNLSSQSGQALGEIVGLAEDASTQVRFIADLAGDHTEFSSLIVASIETTSGLAGRIAEEVSSSLDTLAALRNQAERLSELISQIKTDGQTD